MGQNYNTKNIRVLLKQGFTPEELLELSYDEQAFRPVYNSRPVLEKAKLCSA
jgi:hypothetical protein